VRKAILRPVLWALTCAEQWNDLRDVNLTWTARWWARQISRAWKSLDSEITYTRNMREAKTVLNT